jgi:hypothetical protein
MNTNKNRRCYTNWITIGVTPLNGAWINIWRQDNGDVCTERCPALLLQESTSDTVTWIEDSGTIRERIIDTERTTRVVYATNGDIPGELDPASDVSNYDGTMHESEHNPAAAAS